MMIIPLLIAESSSVYWKSLIGFNALILITASFLQINKPVLNGPISHSVFFVIGPYSSCFLLSNFKIFWKIKIIGVILIPIIYVLSWTLLVNIGMYLRLLKL